MPLFDLNLKTYIRKKHYSVWVIRVAPPSRILGLLFRLITLNWNLEVHCSLAWVLSDAFSLQIVHILEHFIRRAVIIAVILHWSSKHIPKTCPNLEELWHWMFFMLFQKLYSRQVHSTHAWYIPQPFRCSILCSFRILLFSVLQEVVRV